MATVRRMTDLSTRDLTAADDRLLRIATLGNVNWAGERFAVRDVVDRPEFAHYTRLDVARGDFGFVAEHDDTAVGVVWAVFLPAEDPGYGFIDGRTPEASLWIDAGMRGHGLGRRLLRLLKDEARRRGTLAVSLSVEEGNLAERLYESEGFRDVPGRESDGVMIWSSADVGLEKERPR